MPSIFSWCALSELQADCCGIVIGRFLDTMVSCSCGLERSRVPMLTHSSLGARAPAFAALRQCGGPSKSWYAL